MTAALFDHLIVHCRDAIQHTLEIDIDTSLPGLCGLLVISKESKRHDTRIVDHDIDLTKALNSKFDQCMHLLPLADIDFCCGDLPVAAFQVCTELAECCFIDISGHHPSSHPAGFLTNELAKAAGRTRDDDYLVV